MSVRTVRTWPDHEGMHVEIKDEEGQTLASAYEFVRSHGGWNAARDAALVEARRKLDVLQQFGPAPEPSTEPLEEPGLRAV